MGTGCYGGRQLTTANRPLNPGACGATELEFLPLAKGFLQMDAVRVVDVETNESVDVRELPDVLALERAVEAAG